MKANAPEKIYVHRSKHIKRLCASTAQGLNDVEYVRTDAFIEKAWEWVENNVLSINQQDKSRLYFEQFKNYMKGE